MKFVVKKITILHFFLHRIYSRLLELYFNLKLECMIEICIFYVLFQIKSLLLSHHHSTCALMSEILESVLQTVQKHLHIDSTYLQNYTEDNVQNTHTYTQYTQCTIKTYLQLSIHIIHRMYTLYIIISKPGGDAAGQDALHSAGVEGSEDAGARSKLPQPSQEEETLMCLQHCICVSRPCEILGDVNAEELKAGHPLHRCLVDGDGCVFSDLSPVIHHQLLGLVDVE